MAQVMEKAAQLRLMAFDVDGVLTDGTIWFSAEGEVLKGFSSLDGHGLKMLQQAGIELAVITGRRSAALEKRCENLGIRHLAQGIDDKRGELHKLCATLALTPAQCGYMGDDVVDLPILRACGFSASPADAHPLLRQHVDYLSQRPGGRGAAREVCDLILEAKGLLQPMLARYLDEA